MKTFIFLILALFIAFEIGCNAQPNSQTTYELGIVNPEQGKEYKFFAEHNTNTSNPQLIEGMDYLNPDVSGLQIQLQNIHTLGDTLFGEITYQDLDHTEFIQFGTNQTDSITLKYSGMKVSGWLPMGIVEVMNAGFIFRIKK